MVLNGDIVEYHDVGPMENGGVQAGIDHDAIELLINFMEFAWIQYSYTAVQRLSGGGRSFKRTLSGNYIHPMHYAPLRPPAQSRWLSDIRDLGAVSRQLYVEYLEAKSDWTNLGNGRRYVEGLGDSTASHSNIEGTGTWGQAVAAASVYAGGAVIGRRMLTYPGYEPSSGTKAPQSPIPKDFYETRTESSINNKPMSGASMLSWKNKLTRKLKTHYTYRMSTVKICQQARTHQATTPFYTRGAYSNHCTFEGSGPSLYGSYVITPFFTGTYPAVNRNYEMLEIQPEDQGFLTSTTFISSSDDNRKLERGVGCSNTIYWFSADWIGGTMNPFLITQCDAMDYTGNNTGISSFIEGYVGNQKNGNYLMMKKVEYSPSTDLNNPIDYVSIFNTNTRWTYLTHYYTVWNFKFRNLSHQTYCVDFVVFKFKAEYNTFNYERTALAVVNRQKNKFQDYVDGVSSEPEDIKVIFRKRIILGGQNEPLSGSTHWSINKNATNVVNYKYVNRHKYVIKRPILTSFESNFDERQAYYDYYKPENGEYIRLQAWPINPNIRIHAEANSISVANPEEVFNEPTEFGATVDFTTEADMKALQPGVDVNIDKKSYLKFDESVV